MRENGFTVDLRDDSDRNAVRNQYAVPLEIQTCHTAIVDGFVIEGHVPAEDVRRLITERPNVVGLAVLGMPPNSPGMEDGSQLPGVYDVLSFSATGITEVFSRYP